MDCFVLQMVGWENIPFSLFTHKVSLTSSNVDRLRQFWYPSAHAKLLPTCQFNIRHYPTWTKKNISVSRFI